MPKHREPDGASIERHTAICEQTACVEHSVGDGFGALTGAGHDYDLANKGCYGANLGYRVKPVNTNASATGHVFANIVARHAETYFGAAHATEPGGTEADKHYVPQLFEPGFPLSRDAVDLLQERTGHKVAMPALTDEADNVSLKARVANGGAGAERVA